MSGTSAAGVDPFLSAVPALVAVATGLVILRVFPYALRLAGRILARGRSAVSFVGVARASRQGITGVLALVILLLAVALIGFGSTVEASLSRVQRLAAWQSVGGDARVDTLNINPTVIDHVRHSPGVRAVVPAQVIDTANLTSPYGLSDQITVIGVDLDSYRRVMAGTPLQIPAAPKGTGPGAWALFSPALAAEAKASGLTLSTNSAATMPLRSAGTVSGFPAQEPDAKFVLVPADALPRDTGGTSTGSIFVRGDRLDVAALRRNAAQPALGDAGLSAVSTYRMTLDDLAEGELGRLVGTGFGAAAFAVAGYGTLAVLVMLFAGAQARGRAVSYLRTLGLSRRQAHVLAFVEVAPVLLAASVAGWVLGLILPALLGPAIDLRSYTGGSPVTHYVPDLYSTIALTGGLLVFAGLAVLVDAVAGARRGLGGVLRIGDT
jgi:putative ABC transport system permease protein